MRTLEYLASKWKLENGKCRLKTGPSRTLDSSFFERGGGGGREMFLEDVCDQKGPGRVCNAFIHPSTPPKGVHFVPKGLWRLIDPMLCIFF